MISTGRYSKSYFTEQVLKMESSGLRLAISWAHPQGNTDSLWGKLRACETMKKQRHKHKQTQTNKHKEPNTQTKTSTQNTREHLPKETHALSEASWKCVYTQWQRHIFKILFYFFASKWKNKIDSVSRRSGREQLSRLEDFVSDGGTLASSLFSGSLTMRSINLNLRNRDITTNRILRASLTFKCLPICFIMGWVAVGHIFL